MPFVNTIFMPRDPKDITIPKPPSLGGASSPAIQSKVKEIFGGLKAYSAQSAFSPEVFVAIRRIEDLFFAGLAQGM